MRSRRRSMVRMSLSAGTFSRCTGSAVSRAAHRMGRAAFLAPEMAISPCRGCPPVIWSLSIRIRFVFVRGQGAHGQCVDFLFHAVSQGGVDTLMAGDTALAFEFGADDE